MKITFNIIDFDYRFNLFKQSLIDSGYHFTEELYIKSVCIFLGYENFSTLENHLELVRKHSKMENFFSKLRDTFTTSLISHAKKKDSILQKTEDGRVVIENEALKKYTYQQFKSGISHVSAYLKKNDVDISQSSLLKAFSIFLGYKNWNTLSPVIKMKKATVYNILAKDYDSIIESAFLALEDGAQNVYFVDLDVSSLIQQYLKQVNILKHKYKVPLKEILKVKRISKNEIDATIFDGKPVCFISNNEDTSLYIFNRFIKNNKKYELE